MTSVKFLTALVRLKHNSPSLSELLIRVCLAQSVTLLIFIIILIRVEVLIILVYVFLFNFNFKLYLNWRKLLNFDLKRFKSSVVLLLLLLQTMKQRLLFTIKGGRQLFSKIFLFVIEATDASIGFKFHSILDFKVNHLRFKCTELINNCLDFILQLV